MLIFYLIVSKCHRNSSTHKTSPPNCNLQNKDSSSMETCNTSTSLKALTVRAWLRKSHTCWLKLTFSCGDFLARFNKKDNGKTKAALPAKTSPSRIELTPTDFPGLRGNINKNKAKLPPHKTKVKQSLIHSTYILQPRKVFHGTSCLHTY